MKKLLLSAAFVVAAVAGANAQTVLSQTGGVVPTKGTVACSSSDNSTTPPTFIKMSDNAYFRAYTMASNMDIGAVRIGVGSAQGNFPLSVTLYKSTGAFPGSFGSGLTQLATTTVTITSADDLKLVDAAFTTPVSVASGDIIVAKVHHNEGVDNDGLRFYMGVAPTETADGYMHSVGCGMTTPTVMTTISPDARIIIDIVEHDPASTNDFFNSNFAIYPNPTVDVLNIESKNGLVANEIKVTDLSGKVVKVQKDAASVNVSDLATGTYIIDITTNEGRATSKFIKK